MVDVTPDYYSGAEEYTPSPRDLAEFTVRIPFLPPAMSAPTTNVQSNPKEINPGNHSKKNRMTAGLHLIKSVLSNSAQHNAKHPTMVFL